MTFYLPIGDWSQDGHKQYELIVVISSASTLEEVGEEYIKAETKYQFGNWVSLYEEDQLTTQACELLDSLGLKKLRKKFQKAKSPSKKARILAKIIVALVNLEGGEWRLAPKLKYPQLNNWTVDSNLNLPGYGLFDPD